MYLLRRGLGRAAWDSALAKRRAQGAPVPCEAIDLLPDLLQQLTRGVRERVAGGGEVRLGCKRLVAVVLERGNCLCHTGRRRVCDGVRHCGASQAAQLGRGSSRVAQQPLHGARATAGLILVV